MAAASDASQEAVTPNYRLEYALKLAAPFDDTEKQVAGVILDLFRKIAIQPDAAEKGKLRAVLIAFVNEGNLTSYNPLDITAELIFPPSETTLAKITDPELWLAWQKESHETDKYWSSDFVSDDIKKRADEIATFLREAPELQERWATRLGAYPGLRNQPMQPLQLLPLFDTWRGTLYFYYENFLQCLDEQPDVEEKFRTERAVLRRNAVESDNFRALSLNAAAAVSAACDSLFDAKGEAEKAQEHIFAKALEQAAKKAKKHLTPGYLLLAMLSSLLGQYYAKRGRQFPQEEYNERLCNTYFEFALQFLKISLLLESHSKPEINNGCINLPLTVAFFGGTYMRDVAGGPKRTECKGLFLDVGKFGELSVAEQGLRSKWRTEYLLRGGTATNWKSLCGGADATAHAKAAAVIETLARR